MGDDLKAWIGAFQCIEFLARKAFMHFAAPLPSDDLHVGLGLHIFGKVLVRDQQDAADTQAFDHLDGVCRGAADVGFGLYVGAGVHIRDDRHAGIGLPERADIGARY